ncbi:MAG: type I-B CRISPR-associated protein Cas7/Cst2/DevR [Candidatus Cloacimonadota bacterium]|nr:MAG: type I-B CRISPR-associated protein Cas7/Cst2/DevR [Candidatus Cloacimonadota bacterium]PIE78341.1 MAG: type I-B CRISPR-associated protein Cas7/Cst2/DevR [Candidatus Delongbacteria bacterium]
MSNTIQTVFLVDTHVSILNNLGKDGSSNYENSVAVKKIKKEGRTHTYVSGQAFRNWLRTTLGDSYNWNLSPITRDKKIAFTAANPVEYEDDDLFGYMKAEKKETLTRISPLKNSALISVTPVNILEEFKVMARQEGDSVPYADQPYSAILKGILSLDITSLGAFTTVHRAGYMNCTKEYVGTYFDKLTEVDDPRFYKNKDELHKKYLLPKEERVKRASDLLKALNKISGGASQTSHLTDVTPKFIVLAGVEGGNHIFSHLISESMERTTEFSIDALNEIMEDYKDEIKTPVYIGRRKGFMDRWDKDLKELAEKNSNIIYGSPVEIINQFVENDKFKELF